MSTFFALFSLAVVCVWSLPIKPTAEESENIGVYYYGNTSAPFTYLKATITIPDTPLPSLQDQFVYYYFGLSKNGLAALGMVVFCGNKSGCWDSSIPSGYSFYAELNHERGRGETFAGGEKVSIQPGETAEVTIEQAGTYLSVNVTKLNGDGKDSFFYIYGANDGGLIDVIAGIDLQYQSNQKNICDDYNKQPYIISNIIAVETGGIVIDPIDFKRQTNDTNTCGGTVNIGTDGKTLQITGTKS